MSRTPFVFGGSSRWFGFLSLFVGVAVLFLFRAALMGQVPTAFARPRVLVSSDIGGTDPDDFQSMVHLLLCADAFEIEGLVSSPWGAGRKKHILQVIDKYEMDYPKLVQASGLYPAPSRLREVTKQGAINSAGYAGFGAATEGSEWIIRRAKLQDSRTLWILVWGGIEDLAQALHDDPSIKSKIRVYYIGGPNKKWAVSAYDYIAREHPDLWIIEANSTYRGWFNGGNQAGEWSNSGFVQEHLKGHGALGDYFASFLSGTMKMGDSPSVAYLLGKTPEDPSQDSWGGHFVHAWDRRRYRFDKPPGITNEVECFSVMELVYKAGSMGGSSWKASLVVDNQEFPGYKLADGMWHFLFSPKEPKSWTYKIRSSDSTVDGQIGRFVSVLPKTGDFSKANSHFPNWWTDDPDPVWADGIHQGAKTVSRWRTEYLRDFAERAARGQKERLKE